jgi:hypothetical protein
MWRRARSSEATPGWAIEAGDAAAMQPLRLYASSSLPLCCFPIAAAAGARPASPAPGGASSSFTLPLGYDPFRHAARAAASHITQQPAAAQPARPAVAEAVAEAPLTHAAISCSRRCSAEVQAIPLRPHRSPHTSTLDSLERAFLGAEESPPAEQLLGLPAAQPAMHAPGHLRGLPPAPPPLQPMPKLRRHAQPRQRQSAQKLQIQPVVAPARGGPGAGGVATYSGVIRALRAAHGAAAPGAQQGGLAILVQPRAARVSAAAAISLAAAAAAAWEVALTSGGQGRQQQGQGRQQQEQQGRQQQQQGRQQQHMHVPTVHHRLGPTGSGARECSPGTDATVTLRTQGGAQAVCCGTGCELPRGAPHATDRWPSAPPAGAQAAAAAAKASDEAVAAACTAALGTSDGAAPARPRCGDGAALPLPPAPHQQLLGCFQDFAAARELVSMRRRMSTDLAGLRAAA